MVSSASGRFVLRLPPSLHRALQREARDCGLSLNTFCVRRLATAGSGLTADQDTVRVVTTASDLLGDALAAVVVYGSWVRRQATPQSDLDVLVVVEPRIPLTRALYRQWDATTVTWHGRHVDPHFVHPPVSCVGGGPWAEAAIEGIVVFERQWHVSAALARIRRAVADGHLVRRYAHGQPYWVAA